MQTLKNIINKQGGLAALMRGEAVRVRRPDRRALLVEDLGASPRRRHAVRVSQYDERLGDVICIPEMRFELEESGWLPYYFRDDANAETLEAYVVRKRKPRLRTDAAARGRLAAIAAAWDRELAALGIGADDVASLYFPVFN